MMPSLPFTTPDSGGGPAGAPPRACADNGALKLRTDKYAIAASVRARLGIWSWILVEGTNGPKPVAGYFILSSGTAFRHRDPHTALGGAAPGGARAAQSFRSAS